MNQAKIAIDSQSVSTVLSWTCLDRSLSHRQSIGDHFEDRNRGHLLKMAWAALKANPDAPDPGLYEDFVDLYQGSVWDEVLGEFLEQRDSSFVWGVRVPEEWAADIKSFFSQTPS